VEIYQHVAHYKQALKTIASKISNLRNIKIEFVIVLYIHNEKLTGLHN